MAVRAVSWVQTMGLQRALLFGLASLAPLAPALAQDGGPSRHSLEDLLEEVRRARSRAEAELRPQVAEIMSALDETSAKRQSAVVKRHEQDLADLGDAALPLLVQYLDPGGTSSSGTRLRARVTADVLAAAPSIGVTDALLAEATGGSLPARRNALIALRTTPEPNRVLPALVTYARSSSASAGSSETGDALDRIDDLVNGDGEAEQPAGGNALTACYQTIAAFGVPGSARFLTEELTSGNRDRQRLALGALAFGPREAVTGQVGQLLESDAATALAEPLAAFLLENDELLEDDDLAKSTVSLALREELGRDSRIAFFNVLRLSDAKISSTSKKRLERNFAEASYPDLRRSALLLLARNKDRSAKRTLLEDFEARIAAGRNLDRVFRDRAQTFHEIGDWSAAVKDWRAAMKIQKNTRFGSSSDGREHVGIAKSLARMKKYKEAAQYLKESPLSLRERQQLATDRDFRAMLQSKYGSVFKL